MHTDTMGGTNRPKNKTFYQNSADISAFAQKVTPDLLTPDLLTKETLRQLVAAMVD